MQQEQSTNRQKTTDYGLKILAVIGVLAILSIGSFFTITAAKYIPNALRYMAAAAVSLTSIFYQSERIVVSADTLNPLSGKSFTISYEHRGGNALGTYSIAYPCVSGVVLSTGSSTVVCNVATTFVSTTNTLTVTAVSSKNRYVDVPVTIAFTPAGKTVPSVSGSVMVTITNESIANSNDYINGQTNNTGSTGHSTGGTHPVNPGNPSSTSYTYPVGGGSTSNVDNPNGKADLKVVAVDTGIIDANNNFISTSNIKRSDKVGVRFSVQNIGTKHSGSWNFNAILPTSPSYIYNADTQPSIYPGDRVEYTLGFDRVLQGTSTVRIEIDGGNVVDELDETNNVANITIVAQ